MRRSSSPEAATRFSDRRDAGRRLGAALEELALADPVVLGLARGGVPVAAEVAARLGAPLEVFVARKVGAPHQPEFGIGAVAEGGGLVLDRTASRQLGVEQLALDRLVEQQLEELDRRVARYRGGRPLPPVEGRDVVLVDDGLATGVTAEASLLSLRRLGPRRLVLAVPVGAPSTVARLRSVADDVVAVLVPTQLTSVGQWYDRFDQTSDDEVRHAVRPRAG